MRRASGRTLAIAAALVLGGFAAYGAGLAYPPIWDDKYLTTDNPFLDGWSRWTELFGADMWTTSGLGEPSSFYRPVGMLSYLVSAMLSGSSAASFRAGNVLLHAANAALLYVLLRHLHAATPPPSAPSNESPPPEPSESDPHPISRRAALLASTWFLLMPLAVEPVTWLSGRFDVLGATFLLGGLLLRVRHGIGARALAALLLLAALLCKEAFICGIGLYVAQDVLLLRRRTLGQAIEGALVALGLVAYFHARTVVGVPSAEVAASTGPMALVRSYAFLLATYPPLVLAPLSLDPFRLYVPPSAVATVAILTVASSALGSALVAWWRSARPHDTHEGESRGCTRRRRRLAALSFGLLFVLAACAPLSLTGPNLGMVGDRYGYLCSVGVFVMVALAADSGWEWLTARWPGTDRSRMAVAAAIVGLLLLGGLAMQQARLRDWRSERTLYEASVRRDPANPHALYFLGQLEALEEHWREAYPLLLASLERDPESWRTLNALCFVELRAGREDRAVPLCARATVANPRNRRAWFNLASAHARRAQWVECEQAAARGLALDAEQSGPRYLRAFCLAKAGRPSEAQKELDVALGVDPSQEEAERVRRAIEGESGG